MTGWPTSAEARAVRSRMRFTASRLRLSFGRRSWRGASGHWLGVATGSSLEFEDHRPFLPGDDPRSLDWRAYARTGQYLARVYRDEVAPRVDLVLDGSPSMWFDTAKRLRTLELFYFAVESALAARTALACQVVTGARVVPLAREAVLAGVWDGLGPSPDGEGPPSLARLAWRPGSLRVLISDLLFPADPAPLLVPLTARRGRGLILAPFCRAEADPDWSGNREFQDCEGGTRRLQQVDAPLLGRYRAAYARHFAAWRTASARQAVLCCRVSGDEPFEAALARDALRGGAVEPCG